MIEKGGFVLDYPDGYEPISEVCSLCTHLLRWAAPPKCEAFKDETIPMEIWGGENNHTKPVNGDHGLTFKNRR